MCLLVHGGEHILSIDENSPESDNKDADEYAEYPSNHGFTLAIDLTNQGKKQVKPVNSKLDWNDILAAIFEAK